MGKLEYEKVKNEMDALLSSFLDYTTDRLSSITRYSTKRAITTQSVMQHLGSVTLIAMVFSDYLNRLGIKNDTERVMRMSIIHDADEIVSGDIPHPAKYQQGAISENLRSSLNKLADYTIRSTLQMLNNQEMFNSYYGLYVEEKQRSTIEAKIVKLADFADVIIFCMQEKRLGNSTISQIEEEASKKFGELLRETLSQDRL